VELANLMGLAEIACCSLTTFGSLFREVTEECGLHVAEDDLDYVGIIDFEFVGDPVHLEVHVFLARKFEGKTRECCLLVEGSVQLTTV